MTPEDRPRIAPSQLIYGDVVYWITILACIFCMIGPLMSFVSMDGNVLNPQYLFANIWSGMEPDGILKTAGEITASGHYWINNLSAGDGFTQLGVVVGCAVAIPAMFGGALIYMLKEKSFGWALGALWIVGAVTISVLGIVSLH